MSEQDNSTAWARPDDRIAEIQARLSRRNLPLAANVVTHASLSYSSDPSPYDDIAFLLATITALSANGRLRIAPDCSECHGGIGPTAIHAQKTHCVHGHPFAGCGSGVTTMKVIKQGTITITPDNRCIFTDFHLDGEGASGIDAIDWEELLRERFDAALKAIREALPTGPLLDGVYNTINSELVKKETEH